MTIIATGGWTFRAGKPWRYKADDEPEDMYANVNLATASLLAEVMRLRADGDLRSQPRADVEEVIARLEPEAQSQHTMPHDAVVVRFSTVVRILRECWPAAGKEA